MSTTSVPRVEQASPLFTWVLRVQRLKCEGVMNDRPHVWQMDEFDGALKGYADLHRKMMALFADPATRHMVVIFRTPIRRSPLLLIVCVSCLQSRFVVFRICCGELGNR